MLTSLRTAVCHLSVIPVGVRFRKVPEGREGEVLVFFPFAGLLIGMVPAAILVLATLATSRGSWLAAALTAAAFVLVSGAAGLMDLAATVDAAASDRPGAEALTEDPGRHIGPHGTVAIALSLLIRFGALTTLTLPVAVTSESGAAYAASLAGAVIAVLLACTLGRWAAVVLAAYSEYVRPEGGEDEWMVRYCGAREFRWVLVPVAAVAGAAVAASLLKYTQLGWLQVIVAVLAALGTAYLASLYFEKRFGGITGRQLGAVTDVAETAVLTICAMSALRMIA
ncbi:MAG TPA: adenosylcobinamide-GDP ribazoletransferase [Planctomycetota bacterium]|nr:adenosylcobinamide-GDP ribazoletransferase [Planctomycetota bacterium]